MSHSALVPFKINFLRILKDILMVIRLFFVTYCHSEGFSYILQPGTLSSNSETQTYLGYVL